MPAQVHRRMPLSCEPCRERKIRCARNPVPGNPCASCVRRGVPPNQCIFLRDVYARTSGSGSGTAGNVAAGNAANHNSTPQYGTTGPYQPHHGTTPPNYGLHNHSTVASTGSSSSSSTGSSPSNEELLARIHKLEAIVSASANNSNNNSHHFQPTPAATGASSATTAATATASTTTTTTSGTSPSLSASDGPSSSPATTRSAESSAASSDVRGLIIRSASGHERYVPRSSMWSSVLEGSSMADGVDPGGWDAFPSSGGPPPEAASTSWGVATADTVSKYEFPFTPPASSMDMDSLLSSLPAMSHCDALKDLYFDLFHTLHDPTFMADYARFRAQPDAAPKSWLALLYIILSIAVLALDTSSPLLQDLGGHRGGPASATRNVAVLTARFRAAAMRCLEADHYLWRHSLHTLQALLLLVYGINHSHGQSWALLGLVRNMAMAMGCHIDPDHLVVQEEEATTAAAAAAATGGRRHRFDIVAAEQRRRCWAALTMLYVIQNTTMGSIDPTPPAVDGVRLPLDVNDVQLIEGSQAMQTLQTMQTMQTLHTPAAASTPCTQMTYLLYKFRLYGICSRICHELFSSRHVSSSFSVPPYAVVARLDDEIAGLQQTWQRRYEIDTQNAPRITLPVHHTMHLHILFGYSHQLRLLLHRPMLLVKQDTRSRGPPSPSPPPPQPPPPSSASSSSSSSYSRTRCVESALALLSIQRILFESDAFRPFRWYTYGLGSFHAFHAAVLLAYVYGTRGREDTVDGMIPMARLYKEVAESVEVFSGLAATGMSRISEKAATVLRRLLQSSLFAPTIQAPPIPQQSLTPPSSNSMEAGLRRSGAMVLSQDPYCNDTANQQLEAVFGSLQAHQWLSPGAIQWDDWDVFMAYGD